MASTEGVKKEWNNFYGWFKKRIGRLERDGKPFTEAEGKDATKRAIRVLDAGVTYVRSLSPKACAVVGSLLHGATLDEAMIHGEWCASNMENRVYLRPRPVNGRPKVKTKAKKKR